MLCGIGLILPFSSVIAFHPHVLWAVFALPPVGFVAIIEWILRPMVHMIWRTTHRDARRLLNAAAVISNKPVRDHGRPASDAVSQAVSAAAQPAALLDADVNESI